MSPPRFDWTVNLGHVLIIVGILASVVAAYGDLDKRVANNESRIRNEQAAREIAFKWIEARMNRRDTTEATKWEWVQKALRRIEDKLDRKADK